MLVFTFYKSKTSLFFFNCLLYTALSLSSHISNAQSTGAVGIGTNDPDSSAILDISATNRGLLIPRIDGTSLIQPAADGLMIFDSSQHKLAVKTSSGWDTYYRQEDADTLESHIGVLEGRVDRNEAYSVPQGAIVMWSGDVLPEGWALCDGKYYAQGDNSQSSPTPVDGYIATPNLTEKFVRGAPTLGSYAFGGVDDHTRAEIIYDPKSLYITNNSNCISTDPNEYWFSIYDTQSNRTVYPSPTAVGYDCDDAYNSTEYNNARYTKYGCYYKGGNPNYYLNNPDCRTGATSIKVATSTDNKPAYYSLAFIMKL